jgi:DNA-binding transcriptional MerR regulator/DNA gyrase inhibitor GyrI
VEGAKMYNIGEFSKLSGLTVKALRHYHNIELLVPANVDRETGYRVYNRSDLEKARAVVALKEMTFSLTEIKDILESFHEDSQIVNFLKDKRSLLLDRAKKMNAIASSINIIIKSEEKRMILRAENDFEIEIKEVDPITIVGQRYSGKYEDCGKVFGSLAKNFGRHMNGSFFNLLYEGEFKEIADIESCIELKKNVEKDGFETRELAGGKCLSLMHKGPYSNLGDSYQYLMDYIKENDLQTTLPSREIYLKGPGMIFKGNEKNYVTEIQIFIA